MRSTLTAYCIVPFLESQSLEKTSFDSQTPEAVIIWAESAPLLQGQKHVIVRSEPGGLILPTLPSGAAHMVSLHMGQLSRFIAFARSA